VYHFASLTTTSVVIATPESIKKYVSLAEQIILDNTNELKQQLQQHLAQPLKFLVNILYLYWSCSIEFYSGAKIININFSNVRKRATTLFPYSKFKAPMVIKLSANSFTLSSESLGNFQQNQYLLHHSCSCVNN
jgi:hypothetical protein